MLPEKTLTGPSDTVPPKKTPTCEGIPYLVRGLPLCLADSPCKRNSDNELDQLAGVPEIGPNKFCEQLYTSLSRLQFSLRFQFFSYFDFSRYSDFTTFSACEFPFKQERLPTSRQPSFGRLENTGTFHPLELLASVLRYVSVRVFFWFFKILLRDYLCDDQKSVTAASVFLGDLFQKCVPYIFFCLKFQCRTQCYRTHYISGTNLLMKRSVW